MINSSRKNTLEFLKNQYKNVKRVQKTRVNELLKLYEDGHIFSKIAVQKAVNEYLGHAKNPIERELHFYKTMTKYLSSSAKEKKQTKQIKTKDEQIKNLINKVEDTVIEKLDLEL